MTSQERTAFDHPSAEGYDQRILCLVPGYRLLHQVASAALKAAVPDHAKILVSGVGTGNELVSFAAANPTWSFVGLDPSETMLGQARLRSQSLQGRVQLLQATLENSSISGFDAASSVLVSHFVPDDGQRLCHFQSLRRCLRSGGVLVLAELVAWPKETALKSTWQQLANRAGTSQEEVDAATRRLERSFALVSEGRLFSLLETAGFVEPCRLAQVLNVTALLARVP